MIRYNIHYPLNQKENRKNPSSIQQRSFESFLDEATHSSKKIITENNLKYFRKLSPDIGLICSIKTKSI